MALSHSSPLFTMPPPTPSITTLNPFAPEYTPIPPGITPTSTLAPLPYILSQQPSTVVHRLCTQPLSFFTYSSPHSAQEPFYTNYATYYVVPELPSVATNPSPPPPPPPQADVGVQYGQPGRGRSWQRRGFRVGRGRGRGRVNSWRSRENNGGGLEFKFERRPNDKENVGLWSMQKEANRHKIVPLKREEEKTTVMIKNIPYDCPRQELINLLDSFCRLENEKALNESSSGGAHEEHFTCAYDFLYLPIDFRTKKSRGFAFVNFTEASTVWKFFESFHLKDWDSIDRKKWPKKIEVVCAKIQGKEALVSHFSNSVFECETDEFLPVGFNPPRDGSGQALKLNIIGNRRVPVPSPPHRHHWEPPRNNHEP